MAALQTMVVKTTVEVFACRKGSFPLTGTPELPICHYAPDVREVNSQVVFCASNRGEPCKIYRSPDPLNVPFGVVSTAFAFWDPDIFQDEDGRVYLYWGCSSKEPLYGIELDGDTLTPIGEKQVMFGENEARHGWERKGENNKMPPPRKFRDYMMRAIVGTKPFIEGAYVNKYNGKYYLQYAAPGTESNVYSDGVYIGETPLGPWTYQTHNPFSSVPGGFMQGAGHGSTFQDLDGNWWHISTMRISVNENFACYPQALPEGRRLDMARIAPAMHLLCCRLTGKRFTKNKLLRAHVECEIRHMGGIFGKKDLWIGPNLGDWLSPGRDIKYMAMHNGPVSNAFIVNDLLKERCPGFAKVRIEPHIDGRIGAFSGSYSSRHGRICVSFRQGKLEIVTPVEAEIILPNGINETVEPGKYHFLLDPAETAAP